MIDAELLGGDTGAWTIGNLLTDLLTHEDIQFWRYSDDGPPPGTPHRTSTSGQRVAVGWAVAKLAPPGGLATHTLSWSVDKHGIPYGTRRRGKDYRSQAIGGAGPP